MNLHELEHRALDAFHAIPRRTIYTAAALVVGAIVLAGSFGRALHNALDWNDDYATGRVITLQDSVVITGGHVVATKYSGACPAAQLVPVDKKGRDVFDQFQLDPSKVSVITFKDVPRADYGARVETSIDKTTGKAETKAIVANPWFAFENEFTIGGRALFLNDGVAGRAWVPLRAGASWEPISFRAGPGRLWLSIGGGYLRTPGEGGPYGELGLDWRLRGRKAK